MRALYNVTQACEKGQPGGCEQAHGVRTVPVAGVVMCALFLTMPRLRQGLA